MQTLSILFLHLSGIAEETGLYHSNVARVLEPLLENNIGIEKKIGKQIRTFALNEQNKATKHLIMFYDELKKSSVIDLHISSQIATDIPF